MKKAQFFTWPALLLMTLSFLMGVSEFIVVGILPELAQGLDVTITQAGNVVSVFAFAYALGTPFCAAFAGQYGQRRMICICLVLFAAGNLFCSFVTNYTIFLLCRIAIALLSGTMVSLSMTVAGQIAAKEFVSQTIAMVFTGFSIASVFGVPLATTLSRIFGWQAIFLIITLVSLLLLPMLLKALPKAESAKAAGFLQQFTLFTNPKILLGVMGVFLSAAATYTFYTYFSPFLQNMLGFSEAGVSMGLLLYGLAALGSNVYSGKLANNHNMENLDIVYILQMVMLAALVFTQENVIIACINIFAVGFLMYLINSPSQMYFYMIARNENSGCESLASSLSPVFFNMGIATGAFCGGIIVDGPGMKLLGAGGGVFALLALLSCIMLRSYASSRE